MEMTRKDMILYTADIKNGFIHNKLFPLLKDLDHSVDSIEYNISLSDTGECIINEEIVIRCKDGNILRKNITGDSLKAVIIDVLKLFN